jgi:hypothetical protein
MPLGEPWETIASSFGNRERGVNAGKREGNERRKPTELVATPTPALSRLRGAVVAMKESR